MGCTLHTHGHSHGGTSTGHGHSHIESHSTSSSQENINVRAAYIHVISDFVQVIHLTIFIVNFRSIFFLNFTELWSVFSLNYNMV